MAYLTKRLTLTLTLIPDPDVVIEGSRYVRGPHTDQARERTMET